MGAEAPPTRSIPVRGRATVEFNRNEGADNWRLRFTPVQWRGSRPGQFLMLSAGPVGAAPRYDPLLPRPMAVFRSDPSAVEVLYKVTGRGTRLMSTLRRGDEIDFVGPLGVGFPLPPPGVRALLVGGGTGIASLYELAEACLTRGPVSVLLGARREIDLMACADFEALPGAHVEVATEDGSRGHRGRVTELLESALAVEGAAEIYACGPNAMMARASEVAKKAGAPCRVSLENHMACGIGVCLGCAVPRAEGGFALVCRDGPVFPSTGVAWAAL